MGVPRHSLGTRKSDKMTADTISERLWMHIVLNYSAEPKIPLVQNPTQKQRQALAKIGRDSINLEQMVEDNNTNV